MIFKIELPLFYIQIIVFEYHAPNQTPPPPPIKRGDLDTALPPPPHF